MEVIKFYGRFFGNISAAYGVSGYYQAHTKAKYPPGVFALYVQRIYTNTPTQSQYLMGLTFAHQCLPTACVWVHWSLYPSGNLTAYRLNIKRVIRNSFGTVRYAA